MLQNFRAYEFATHVHAGLAVGWLHNAVALVGERIMGRGRFLASTFRLSRHLRTNPLATLLLDEMIGYLATR